MGRHRNRSCPPCLHHNREDSVTLPNGLICMTRCITREQLYRDLQIYEDRSLKGVYIPIIGEVGQRRTEVDSGEERSDDTDDHDFEHTWFCACGTRSPAKARFCYICGRGKALFSHIRAAESTPESLLCKLTV
mmetsp:Transcript_100797/g.159435  ORF Transcript_100797/g.159435 Transcript_100797/m.159435 type:complete len:133 (+) Transcript_100797:78-476(+)